MILISVLSLQTSWCLEAEGKSLDMRSAMVQNPGHWDLQDSGTRCQEDLSLSLLVLACLCCCRSPGQCPRGPVHPFPLCFFQLFREISILINGPLPSCQPAVLPAPGHIGRVSFVLPLIHPSLPGWLPMSGWSPNDC